MKGLYIRWIALLLIFGTIALLGLSRYNRDVRTVSPKEILEGQSDSERRLLGMIDPGTLVKGSAGMPFRFQLSGEGGKVSVLFSGEDQDTLRELKTIVVIGRWNGDKRVFHADQIALIPNYDFIAWAYLASLVPLAFFLFHMERKVALLYIMIKEEKLYQVESGT